LHLHCQSGDAIREYGLARPQGDRRYRASTVQGFRYYARALLAQVGEELDRGDFRFGELALELRLALDTKCLDERHQCICISNIEALEARSAVLGAAFERLEKCHDCLVLNSREDQWCCHGIQPNSISNRAPLSRVRPKLLGNANPPHTASTFAAAKGYAVLDRTN
jgi:hypothetical protein